MSLNRVRKYLSSFGKSDDIIEMDESTATVQLAAQALNIHPARIAKTLALKGKDSPIIVVAAGDARIDNKKFRSSFGRRPSMLSPEDTFKATGFNIGGVCPFALPEGLSLNLDESIRRFTSVYPACGTSNSVIGLSLDELKKILPEFTWVDVCKDWDSALT